MNHKTEENDIQKKMIPYKENAMNYLKNLKDKKRISELLTNIATLLTVGFGVYFFICSLCEKD